MDQRNEYLTLADAASRLGFSETKVRKLAREGKLASHREGRRHFITRSSVDVLDESNDTSEPTNDESIATTKQTMSRRNWMALGVSGFITLGGLVKTRHIIWDELESILTEDVEVEDLFPMWKDIVVVPGGHHPVLDFHPDIKIALDRMTPLLPRTDDIVVLPAEELPVADRNRDLVLIGGQVRQLPGHIGPQVFARLAATEAIIELA